MKSWPIFFKFVIFRMSMLEACFVGQVENGLLFTNFDVTVPPSLSQDFSNYLVVPQRPDVKRRTVIELVKIFMHTFLSETKLLQATF